jgi:hypothetical protein
MEEKSVPEIAGKTRPNSIHRLLFAVLHNSDEGPPEVELASAASTGQGAGLGHSAVSRGHIIML